MVFIEILQIVLDHETLNIDNVIQTVECTIGMSDLRGIKTLNIGNVIQTVECTIGMSDLRGIKTLNIGNVKQTVECTIGVWYLCGTCVVSKHSILVTLNKL